MSYWSKIKVQRRFPKPTWSCSHWPFQGMIPKLIALQRGWFRHVKKDFRRFASPGTKRIGTWPYLSSPWVIGCPNTPLCLISLLTFHFLGNIPFYLLPLLLKWTRLLTWTPQPLGLGSSQKGLFYSGRLCPWPLRTCPLHNIETTYNVHTHEVIINYKPKVKQFDVGDFVYF